MKPKRYR